jgi:hypothetical protein
MHLGKEDYYKIVIFFFFLFNRLKELLTKQIFSAYKNTYKFKKIEILFYQYVSSILPQTFKLKAYNTIKLTTNIKCLKQLIISLSPLFPMTRL